MCDGLPFPVKRCNDAPVPQAFQSFPSKGINSHFFTRHGYYSSPFSSLFFAMKDLRSFLNKTMSLCNQPASSSSHDRQPPCPVVVPFSIFSTFGRFTTLLPCTLNADFGCNEFQRCFGSGKLPITNTWYMVEAKIQDLREWAKCSPGYTEWVYRVSEAIGEAWKSWGIYDMIQVHQIGFP